MDHQKFIAQGKRVSVELERISGLPYAEFKKLLPPQKMETLVKFIDSGGHIENISEIVLFLWVSINYPGQVLPDEEWIRLFRMHGYFSNDDVPLPESVTVYRGALPEYARGLGWTTNPRVAADYSGERGRKDAIHSGTHVNDHRGRIYMVEAPAESILGHNNLGDERAWLLDARELPIVEVSRDDLDLSLPPDAPSYLREREARVEYWRGVIERRRQTA